MSFFSNLSKRAKTPKPGGTPGKYSGILKLGGALAGGAHLMYDPEVTGMRGSAKKEYLGLSVDQAKDKKKEENLVVEDQQRQAAAAAAAAAAAEEEPFTKAKKSQADALRRKGRRASILTSPQGAGDPLGIPG